MGGKGVRWEDAGEIGGRGKSGKALKFKVVELDLGGESLREMSHVHILQTAHFNTWLQFARMHCCT